MNVSVRDLKNRLSEYLRRVRAGERLTVTGRGRAIAEVHPLRASRRTPEQRLRDLAAPGEVTLPRGHGLSDVEPLRVEGWPVSETLLEDRG